MTRNETITIRDITDGYPARRFIAAVKVTPGGILPAGPITRRVRDGAYGTEDSAIDYAGVWYRDLREFCGLWGLELTDEREVSR